MIFDDNFKWLKLGKDIKKSMKNDNGLKIHSRYLKYLLQWNLDITNLDLYNKVLSITNDFLYPSYSKTCEKEP